MTEHFKACVLKLKTYLGGDDLTACKNSDIAKHFFSAVAKSGSLDSNTNKCAAELVKHESGKSLTLNILCYYHKLSACLNYLLKNREDLLNIRYLFIGDKYKGVVKNSLHLIHIGCHIGREVSAVKLHTLNYLGVGICRL